MKVVINKEHGGLTLTHDAKILIFERSKTKVYPYIRDADFSTMVATYTRITPSTEIEDQTSVEYFSINPSEDLIEIDMTNELIQDVSDTYKAIEPHWERSDSKLISVIEDLGKKAVAYYSKPKIVEIPDEYEFIIDSSDGWEHLYYGHDLHVI
ncbi:hypothetical protein ABE869_08070 [Enterococcus gilvus]|uniref:hypothetical protein n=1 Tax=Enterococcus gilvus TaxID=160453 RepID=UPI003D6A20EC